MSRIVRWTDAERRALGALESPGAIQAFLDGLEYSADPFYRSPRSVLRDRKAHCFDGAVLAACALDRLGLPPRLLDLRAVNDDDHVIAVFERRGLLGAVAKSNFVGLRYREPVYRTPRELALSYFELFYNVDRERTLRSFSAPLDLSRLDPPGWRIDDAAMDAIADALDRARHTPLLSDAAARELLPMDERSYRAGMMGINEAGLYRKKG
ncbi:MAG: hypothetical protein M0R80_05795 [Proteobacteria bacterium]|jgi:hypothetical protein|nr:hypothetical protein [Pseudomonadota bacterium]